MTQLRMLQRILLHRRLLLRQRLVGLHRLGRFYRVQRRTSYEPPGRADLDDACGTCPVAQAGRRAEITEQINPVENTASVCHQGNGMSFGRPTNVRIVPVSASAVRADKKPSPPAPDCPVKGVAKKGGTSEKSSEPSKPATGGTRCFEKSLSRES